MKTIVSLKDTAARIYGMPFSVQAPAQAVRSLQDEVNSQTSTSDVHNHPSDFELYEIASFNEDSGILVPHPLPLLLCRAKDLLNTI